MEATAQDRMKQQNSAGSNSAAALKKLGIDLSPTSLTQALKDPRPRVRVFAAYQLEKIADQSSIPSIETAYAMETDPMSRVGLATALAGLKDPRGSEFLLSMCTDTNLPINVQIRTLQMLQLLGDEGRQCGQTFLSSLKSDATRDYRDTIISLVPYVYRAASPELGLKLVGKTEEFLLDKSQQPSVRLAAGQSLEEIGLPSSASAIKQAIAEESDPVLQSSLMNDLAALQKRM